MGKSSFERRLCTYSLLTKLLNYAGNIHSTHFPPHYIFVTRNGYARREPLIQSHVEAPYTELVLPVESVCQRCLFSCVWEKISFVIVQKLMLNSFDVSSDNTPATVVEGSLAPKTNKREVNLKLLRSNNLWMFFTNNQSN